jgi:hypothetical protein
MKIIYNTIIPPEGFAAINLFGLLFARRGAIISQNIINHERIHTAQMKEMLYIFFYVWYVTEWIIRLPMYKSKAYRNISFEREAYANMTDYGYLRKRRKPYAWIKYILLK